MNGEQSVNANMTPEDTGQNGMLDAIPTMGAPQPLAGPTGGKGQKRTPKKTQPTTTTTHALLPLTQSEKPTAILSIDEQKAIALAIYADTGSIKAAADDLGLPASTVGSWIHRDDDGQVEALAGAMRLSMRERIGHLFAEVARRSMEELLDRVNNGDLVQRKDGLVRVPMSGTALNWVASMAADKHALYSGLTTAKQKDENARLEQMAATAVRQAMEARDKRDGRRPGTVLDVEPIRVAGGGGGNLEGADEA